MNNFICKYTQIMPQNRSLTKNLMDHHDNIYHNIHIVPRYLFTTIFPVWIFIFKSYLTCERLNGPTAELDLSTPMLVSDLEL